MIVSDFNRDVKKMLEYKSKGSNPEALARSVKDIEKAINRYSISRAIGWDEAEDAFYNRLLELGLSEDDIDSLDEISLDTEQQEKFDKASKLGATGRYSLPTTLDRYLRSLGLSYEMKHISERNSDAYYQDRFNGRRYTILDEVTCSNGVKFYFANHTNEGGGTYGYALSNNPYNGLAGDNSLERCLTQLKYIMEDSGMIGSAVKPQSNIKRILKKAEKNSGVKILDYEYVNSLTDWMVILDTDDEYEGRRFQYQVDELLNMNSGEHSYDDMEGLGDIHLGEASYYEVSDDEYEDLREDVRDKQVVYCEPANKYKSRRMYEW